MKTKLICLLSICFIHCLSIKAQSAFEISNTNGDIITNSTLNIEVDYFDQISKVLNVKNKSNTVKALKMKKEIKIDLAGTNITMCSGAFCHSPATLVTPTAVNLNPNGNLLAINEEFHMVFQPFGNLGPAEVKYTIFEDGGNDSVFVLAKFNSITVGLNTLFNTKNLNIQYENKQLKIKNESELAFTLEVYDLLGKKINALSSNRNETYLDLPADKFYQIRFVVDGKVYTKKIISY